MPPAFVLQVAIWKDRVRPVGEELIALQLEPSQPLIHRVEVEARQSWRSTLRLAWPSGPEGSVET